MQLLKNFPHFLPYIRRHGFLHAILACAIPLLIAACTSPQDLPVPGAGWKSHTGQLLYRAPEGRSVIGEAVVRHSGRNDFALSFLSGPGFPLLKIQVSGDNVLAEGAMAEPLGILQAFGADIVRLADATWRVAPARLVGVPYVVEADAST
ncbi:MAG: hypothetical protein EOP84_35815, partial [Verrucomicrobiaceae bacterium]